MWKSRVETSERRETEIAPMNANRVSGKGRITKYQLDLEWGKGRGYMG